MAEYLRISDATIGERYTVVFRDCCVSGDFEAVLLSATLVAGSPYLEEAKFDNGVTINKDQAVELWPEGREVSD